MYLPTLCPNLEERERFLITNRPGESLLTGVVKSKLILFATL